MIGRWSPIFLSDRLHWSLGYHMIKSSNALPPAFQHITYKWERTCGLCRHTHTKPLEYTSKNNLPKIYWSLWRFIADIMCLLTDRPRLFLPRNLFRRKDFTTYFIIANPLMLYGENSRGGSWMSRPLWTTCFHIRDCGDRYFDN